VSKSVHCSRCGGNEDLYFVTCRELGDSSLGRILVYCQSCRSEMQQIIDISVPLTLVTKDLFLSLYRLGKTASDPMTSVNIVFGIQDHRLQSEVEKIIQELHTPKGLIRHALTPDQKAELT
jgi:hypothetical protein